MWGIILDAEKEQPLKRQLYEAIKSRILSGQLKASDTMPSTRVFSKTLNISRSTVVEAYDMLLSEGYIVSRQGAPTRVAEGLGLDKPTLPDRPMKSTPIGLLKADFHTGRPDLRQFPQYLWRQLLNKAAGELPIELYGYTGPQGLPALRSAIAAWLSRSRGIEVHPDDIFITEGATHALHLLAELLCTDGKKILMEDPCNSEMLQTFLHRGCQVVPIPADAHGVQTQFLPDGTGACAVYVTPSHQFPMGGILPASRRATLIRYARENDLFIIEDDYDSEFRYCGEPIAPLYTMDPLRVVYIGTFSKVLFPALRVGFAIVPAQLQARWSQLRTHTDVQSPLFEQAALTEFLLLKKLDMYVLKMRRIYGQRRKVLLEALKENLALDWTASGDAAGLHVAINFPELDFDDTFMNTCLQHGVYITLLEKHCIEKGRHRSALLLGYGHLEPDEIRSAVRLLADLIKQHQANSSSLDNKVTSDWA